MDELTEQIRRIAVAHPELPSDLNFGPTSESDVNHIEERLGVKLPPSFRAYLLGFAGGNMLGYEIYGIPTIKSRVPTRGVARENAADCE